MTFREDDLPRAAALTAARAHGETSKLGHDTQALRWRRLSGRMWAATCPSCGEIVWVCRSSAVDEFVAGGSATRSQCTGSQGFSKL